MHDEQIRPGGDGEFHRGQAGVHGGGDAADRAAILHLQTVGRAVIIANSLCAQNFVAMGDDGGEQGFWHGTMETLFGEVAKREAC